MGYRPMATFCCFGAKMTLCNPTCPKDWSEGTRPVACPNHWFMDSLRRHSWSDVAGVIVRCVDMSRSWCKVPKGSPTRSTLKGSADNGWKLFLETLRWFLHRFWDNIGFEANDQYHGNVQRPENRFFSWKTRTSKMVMFWVDFAPKLAHLH